MAFGTPTSARCADFVGRTPLGVPSAVEFFGPVAPVAISIPSLIVIIPSILMARAGT